MRVLIAPDSFTGTMSAEEAAEAIAAGWARTRPADLLDEQPMSDGGPGFVSAIQAGLGGARVARQVAGPLGEPVTAEFLLTGAGLARTAWIESAQAAGLHLVPADLRDPTSTTSLGVGQLIGHAVEAGAVRIVVGVGGTGSCDGGAGVLAGLGATCAGGSLVQGGAGLVGVREVDLSPAAGRLTGVELLVATDVDVPLCGPRGAARGFAPQKGAGPEQVAELERNLAGFADLLGPDGSGRRPAVALGAGAGGGIGFALLRLGGRRVSGVRTVNTAVDLAGQVAGCDLVVTGEGSLDWQSMRGKVIAGVTAAAAQVGAPVIVLAGRVQLSRRDWVGLGLSAAYAVQPDARGHADLPPDPRDAPALLADLAARVARTWSPALP